MKPYVLKSIVLVSLLAVAQATVASDSATGSQSLKDDQKLWTLEHAYWRYVEENDLAAYSRLWHKEFLGWPSVSAAPVRKDHITQWITNQTSKGLVFKMGEFKPAEIQVTGNMAIACYWVTFKWVEKDGTGDAHTTRITHAWLRTGHNWQIIGGMSMPEPDTPRK